MAELLETRNGEPVPLEALPRLAPDAMRQGVLDAVAAGRRLVALFGQRLDGGLVRLCAALADPATASVGLATADVRERYPSLAADCPQAQLFEREIHEQWQVTPDGHPWLKPVRGHAPYAGHAPADRAAAPEQQEFWRPEGHEAHEVAVGPVHAGVIEPGHFRFQCHGEDVLHLEIALGYQHRGVERALVGGPTKRTVHYLETAAGDTTIGHATAHAEALEGLAGTPAPPRALVLRGIALELERLANHTGDLGALAGDVGFLPTAAYCGRLRGDWLNLTAELCGSRFGRGLVRPGGVAFDLDRAAVPALVARLDAAARDTAQAIDLLWSTPSVLARFEACPLTRASAVALGIVGPAARACGLERDVRCEFPAGIYRLAQLPVSTWGSGDVHGRARVRALEIARSAAFVREQLLSLPAGPTRAALAALAPNHLVVTLVEGWRGQIAHVALTGEDGRLAAYKIVDPSFFNWSALALAMRGQPISDFPLCNKSFNLSYCGHDL